jgi:phospholipase/carboxylesterase
MIGQLPCRVVEEGSGEPSLAVVLCHGYGAPGDDLVPLGAELFRLRPALAGKVRFVFPEAPLAAWWPIPMEYLVSVQSGDREGMNRMRHEAPEGLTRARRLLIGLVEELARLTQLPFSQIVLGGFSQGAMLATEVALKLEESPAGLVVFSGTLVNEKDWAQRAPARKGLGVLQFHGRQDPLLPFDNAVALRDLLVNAGLPVDFHPFQGGHTLPPDGLERLGDFLLARLPR